MKSRILSIEKVPFETWSHGDSFEFEVGWAANQVDARKLGFSVTVVPPGKRAWPYHARTIRIGETSHKIRQGDLIGLPPGRPVSKGSIRHFTRADDKLDDWDGEK